MTEESIHHSTTDAQKDTGLPWRVRRETESYQTDQEAWDEFRAGSKVALTYIYREYADKMYNYGCQFTASEALVSDCIQELFTEMISNLDRLGSTGSVKFYLFKALRRKLHRALKKEKKSTNLALLSPPAQFHIQNDAEVTFIQREFVDYQKNIIERECNQLPVKQREALLLYYYEGLSYREIAEIIGMTRTKSARALIYRAVDSLYRRMKQYRDFLYPLFPLFIITPWH